MTQSISLQKCRFLDERAATVEQKYERVRRSARRFDVRDSCYVAWAYSNLMQLPEFDFPSHIQTIDSVFREEERNRFLHEWRLEDILGEIFRHGSICRLRTRSLRLWNDFGEISNRLHDFENEVYRAYTESENVFLELARISHRQFRWQLHGPNLGEFAKFAYLYSDPRIDSLVERRTNLNTRSYFAAGFGLFSHFIQNHRFTNGTESDHNQYLNSGTIEAMLGRVSMPMNMIHKRYYSPEIHDDKYIYTPSPLRAFPILSLGEGENVEYICPMPTLLFWRVTGGIYYDLISDPDFGNLLSERFEQYIGGALNGTLETSKFEVCAELEYAAGSSSKIKKSVDWIVKSSGGDILLIECKLKRITQESISSIHLEGALERDIAALSAAVFQCYRNIYEIIAGYFPDGLWDGAGQIFPIIVTLEDWYATSSSYREVVENNVRSKLTSFGQDPAIVERCPFCICSSDELIASLYYLNDFEIPGVFGAKASDKSKRSYQLLPFLMERFPDTNYEITNPYQSEFDDFFDEVAPESPAEKKTEGGSVTRPSSARL